MAIIQSLGRIFAALIYGPTLLSHLSTHGYVRTEFYKLNMLIPNTCRRLNEEVDRILEELEALDDGASDDIFQTRASPFEEQLPLNIPINPEEHAGVVAEVSTMQHRLQSLFPIEQGPRPAALGTHQLMEEIVQQFRLILIKMPRDDDPIANFQRKGTVVHGYVDDVWLGRACHFPDGFLRRLRPQMPQRWDLDCWIARCLVREAICIGYSVPYDAIEQDADKVYYQFKDAEECARNPGAAMAMMMISVYVSRLPIQLAAWLPFELLILQAQRDVTVHEAFIEGTDYYERLVFPASDEMADADFHICLSHVRGWLDCTDWHGHLIGCPEEQYRAMFWDAVDRGTDEWRQTP